MYLPLLQLLLTCRIHGLKAVGGNTERPNEAECYSGGGQKTIHIARDTHTVTLPEDKSIEEDRDSVNTDYCQQSAVSKPRGSPHHSREKGREIVDVWKGEVLRGQRGGARHLCVCVEEQAGLQAQGHTHY